MKKENFYKVVEVNKIEQPWLKNAIIAFLSGGIVGILNQGFIDFNMIVLNLTIQEASALSSIFIVFIASLLTLLGLYKHQILHMMQVKHQQILPFHFYYLHLYHKY